MGMMITATNGSVEKPQRTVLIVDDTTEDRCVYRRYLLQDEEWRYRVLEAETGAEALALCRESQPDCILLDYRLPDLNGLEVLVALTRDCEEAICPVVMLTGEEDIAVAVAALKSGAQDYLNKNTLTAVDLIHAVNNAVERVALRRENERQRRELLEQNHKLEEALAERKQAEEALRESEERFRAAVENFPHAFILYDGQRRYRYLNEWALRFSRRELSSIIGKLDEEIWPSSITRHYLPTLERAIETKTA